MLVDPEILRAFAEQVEIAAADIDAADVGGKTSSAGDALPGAAAGAAFGVSTGPLAVGTVPLFAFAGSLIGGWKGADLGEAVGNILCPC